MSASPLVELRAHQLVALGLGQLQHGVESLEASLDLVVDEPRDVEILARALGVLYSQLPVDLAADIVERLQARIPELLHAFEFGGGG